MINMKFVKEIGYIMMLNVLFGAIRPLIPEFLVYNYTCFWVIGMSVIIISSISELIEKSMDK